MKINMQEILDGFKKFDYNNPDFENMGSWPFGVQIVTCLLLSGLIIAGGWYFLIRGDYAILASEQRIEERTKDEFRNKAFQVANIDAFKVQLEDMRNTFGALLEQLPNETEISGLLEDISFTGLQSGLEFESLELQKDVASEFYIETPIQIQVLGGYHELGTFVSGISALPRIVTLHDFKIRQVSSSRGSSSEEAGGNTRAPLAMEIVAKTYRYNPGGVK